MLKWGEIVCEKEFGVGRRVGLGVVLKNVIQIIICIIKFNILMYYK